MNVRDGLLCAAACLALVILGVPPIIALAIVFVVYTFGPVFIRAFNEGRTR